MVLHGAARGPQPVPPDLSITKGIKPDLLVTWNARATVSDVHGEVVAPVVCGTQRSSGVLHCARIAKHLQDAVGAATGGKSASTSSVTLPSSFTAAVRNCWARRSSGQPGPVVEEALDGVVKVRHRGVSGGVVGSPARLPAAVRALIEPSDYGSRELNLRSSRQGLRGGHQPELIGVPRLETRSQGARQSTSCARRA